MQTYKVLQYFTWGRLPLNKGEIIEIEDLDETRSLVKVKHYPDRNQPVGKRAAVSMVQLKKIEPY